MALRGGLSRLLVGRLGVFPDCKQGEVNPLIRRGSSRAPAFLYAWATVLVVFVYDLPPKFARKADSCPYLLWHPIDPERILCPIARDTQTNALRLWFVHRVVTHCAFQQSARLGCVVCVLGIPSVLFQGTPRLGGLPLPQISI